MKIGNSHSSLPVRHEETWPKLPAVPNNGSEVDVCTTTTKPLTQEKFGPSYAQIVMQGSSGADAKAIRLALEESTQGKDTKILVLGYSPTGGGHTARSLDIVHEAIESGQLPPKSMVVMHVPEKWEGQTRPAVLSKLVDALRAHGINVIVAEGDKPVYGYLNPQTGGSDDAAILDRFAHYPKRLIPNAKMSIAGCKLVSGSHIPETLPTISANHLMDSIADIVGPSATSNKTYVLTDMAPDLQKAAKKCGVPDGHRVDQQNHGSMVLTGDSPQIRPEHALLAKVLGGTGELIAHIGLGEKNTLLGMTAAVDVLKLSPESTKKDALTTIADYFIQNGKQVSSESEQKKEGIIYSDDIKSGAVVKNIVYVYAHANTNRIAEHIQKKVNEKASDYQGTLFVFCGAQAVKGANAMHLAYLADADGMTTAGAGTNGEFAYLNKRADAQANLMVLPIRGHNEQEANAKALCSNDTTKPFVTKYEAGSALGPAIDAFVGNCTKRAGGKYASGTLSPMINAINDKDTYARQACGLLFGTSNMSRESKELAEIEQKMHDSSVLKTNRKFTKMVFQVLKMVKDNSEKSAPELLKQSFGVALTKKPESQLMIKNLDDVVHHLNHVDLLTKTLGSPARLNSDDLLLLSETKELFENIRQRLQHNLAVPLDEIKALAGKFGDSYITGF